MSTLHVSSRQVLSDADVRDRIRRIRERYAMADDAAPRSVDSRVVADGSGDALARFEDDNSSSSAIVGRLESTVQRLQRRTCDRTDAQIHLEALVASLSHQRPWTGGGTHTALLGSEGTGSAHCRHALQAAGGARAASSSSSSSSPSLGKVIGVPRRVMSQCRPARMVIRLTVPMLLRYPILFPSLDAVGVSLVLPLDSMMETSGDALTLSLLQHLSDVLVRPALETSNTMDASAALIRISLRGVRESLLRLQDPSEAANDFVAVLPATQRHSCVCSVGSAVEGAPLYVSMQGAKSLFEVPVLRVWSQRLWALLRLRAESADPASEDPVTIDMFLFERDALREKL